MQISATGNRRAAPDGGFSLVEALTTLLIIGLMASAVMLLAPGPDRETRAFAERFAARLAAAGEESIINNRPIALVMNDDGYGFERLEERGWVRLPADAALAFRAWPNDMEFRIVDAAEPDSGRVVRFDTTGGATPARMVLSRGGAEYEIAIDGQGRARVAALD